MNRIHLFFVALAFATLLHKPVVAQTRNNSQLTIEQIMQSSDIWRGAEPDNMHCGFV